MSRLFNQTRKANDFAVRGAVTEDPEVARVLETMKDPEPRVVETQRNRFQDCRKVEFSSPVGKPLVLNEKVSRALPGEAYRGLQVSDHQHPHDLLMQISAAWRLVLGEHAGLTIAGGPVGEATLGPVAFMHRPSAAENPTVAPFDATKLPTTGRTAPANSGALWSVPNLLYQ